MTCHTKLSLVQDHFVLEFIKWMDLLGFMMGLDIKYYLALEIELDIFQVKKMVLHMFFLIIMQQTKIYSYKSLKL